MSFDDKEKFIAAFSRGSAVDHFLSEDYNTFHDLYEIVSGVTMPTSGSNADKLFNACINQKQEDWGNPKWDLLDAYDSTDIKESFEATIKKFDMKILDFFARKKHAELEGKHLILEQDYITAVSAVTKVINSKNPMVNRIFMNIPGIYESVKQLEIYETIEGIPCKIKIDVLIVDHFNKTLQLVDIKTTSDYSSNIDKAIENFRYDIQSEFYHMVYNQSAHRKQYENYGLKWDFDFCVLPLYNSEPIVASYRCGQERPLNDIRKAMDIYRKTTENGLYPNKQNYVELLNAEGESYELNSK